MCYFNWEMAITTGVVFGITIMVIEGIIKVFNMIFKIGGKK